MPPIANQPARPGLIARHKSTPIRKEPRLTITGINMHAQPASVELFIRKVKPRGKGSAIKLKDPIPLGGVEVANGSGGECWGEDGVVEARARVVGLYCLLSTYTPKLSQNDLSQARTL